MGGTGTWVRPPVSRRYLQGLAVSQRRGARWSDPQMLRLMSMSSWEETLGQTPDTLERLYLSDGSGTPGILPEELVEEAGERGGEVWAST